ncbi:hypothetical protein LCGC14_0498640 [marine sediment metagenome]|uniref:Uncharacterized protein n=1 Tax=marine sediment metagenome TaxID=412755 RepID=A0A0F9S4L0_9ZZZZ
MGQTTYTETVTECDRCPAKVVREGEGVKTLPDDWQRLVLYWADSSFNKAATLCPACLLAHDDFMADKGDVLSLSKEA